MKPEEAELQMYWISFCGVHMCPAYSWSLDMQFGRFSYATLAFASYTKSSFLGNRSARRGKFYLQDMAEKMIKHKEKIKSRMSTNEFVAVRTVLDIFSCLVCIAEMQGSLLI